HTILLLQRSSAKESRTYDDFETVEEALESIIRMYEARLKTLCPAALHVNYSLDDLNRFIDQHKECCMLVLDPDTNTYTSHDLAWIKSSIHSHLRKLLQMSKGSS
ncbi:enhancer of rudimentary, partial [Martensiomyces pterosporus]